MRNKVWGISALTGAILLTGCTAKAGPIPEYTPPTKVTVRYEVDSTNGKPAYDSIHGLLNADVTMSSPTGTVQVSPDIPMTRKTGETGAEYEFVRGEFVYLSAQKKDYYGDIVCRIYVDDVLISENSSSGEYAVVTCDGNAR